MSKITFSWLLTAGCFAVGIFAMCLAFWSVWPPRFMPLNGVFCWLIAGCNFYLIYVQDRFRAKIKARS